MERSLALKVAALGLSAMTYKDRKVLNEALEDPKSAQIFARKKVLDSVHESPLFFATTSGSTGPKKEIPYTSSLKRSFSKMFNLWAWDILHNLDIDLKTGCTYFSVSPKISDLNSGINNDLDYVNSIVAKVMKRFVPVPFSTNSFQNGEEFFDFLSMHLLGRKDLEVLSVWSPGFLLSFMNYVESHPQRLGFSGSWTGTWPNLQLISCWDSGSSQLLAKKLNSIFPNAKIQGKGLLATEGPMTMPWVQAEGKIPILTETYFLFKSSSGSVLKLHEVKEGEIYEVIPSFTNGLIDYQIGDHVIVNKFYKKTPCLEFVGRSAESSDLFGEKLSGQLLRDLFLDFPLEYFVALPRAKNYQILWQSQSELKPEFFEHALRKSHHYKLARELGQLEAVSAKKVDDLVSIVRNTVGRGKKIGDLKEMNLISKPDLIARIDGYLCES